MKKLLLFLILLLIGKSFAQSYVPLLQDGNKWYELKRDFNFDGPSPLFKTYIVINGEETKNGIVYKKLFSNLYCYSPDGFLPCDPTGNVDVFYKLLRENVTERKVYFYDQLNNADILLYDFSLTVGDQIPYNFPLTATNADNDPNSVWIINKIIPNGKVFNKTISKTFIKDNFIPNSNNIYEGIGSNLGLLYPPGRPIFEGGNFLECFESTDSGKSCEYYFLSSVETPKSEAFSLVYTRELNAFRLVGNSTETAEITFYDFSGKVVEVKKVKLNENFSLLKIFSQRILLFKITTSELTQTGKIILK